MRGSAVRVRPVAQRKKTASAVFFATEGLDLAGSYLVSLERLMHMEALFSAVSLERLMHMEALFSFTVKPTVVIPFAEHVAFFGFGNKMSERFLVRLRVASLIERDIICPYTLV